MSHIIIINPDNTDEFASAVQLDAVNWRPQNCQQIRNTSECFTQVDNCYFYQEIYLWLWK